MPFILFNKGARKLKIPASVNLNPQLLCEKDDNGSAAKVPSPLSYEIVDDDSGSRYDAEEDMDYDAGSDSDVIVQRSTESIKELLIPTMLPHLQSILGGHKKESDALTMIGRIALVLFYAFLWAYGEKSYMEEPINWMRSVVVEFPTMLGKFVVVN